MPGPEPVDQARTVVRGSVLDLGGVRLGEARRPRMDRKDGWSNRQRGDGDGDDDDDDGDGDGDDEYTQVPASNTQARSSGGRRTELGLFFATSQESQPTIRGMG